MYVTIACYVSSLIQTKRVTKLTDDTLSVNLIFISVHCTFINYIFKNKENELRYQHDATFAITKLLYRSLHD